jgi:hypothetical protein
MMAVILFAVGFVAVVTVTIIVVVVVITARACVGKSGGARVRAADGRAGVSSRASCAPVPPCPSSFKKSLYILECRLVFMTRVKRGFCQLVHLKTPMVDVRQYLPAGCVELNDAPHPVPHPPHQ